MSIKKRKADHLTLCASDEVAFSKKTTLFESIHLIHDCLPERAIDELDTSAQLLGCSLKVPLLIAGMTGGIREAEPLNKALASVAEEQGLAFGFGSMRPLLKDPKAPGYQVRDVAPTALLIGNLGAVQAAQVGLNSIEDLVGHAGLNAMAIHLNPAQEVIQSEGDRDFRGLLEAIKSLAENLSVPLVVKETGCGISTNAANRLARSGVGCVDVGGAGGTSWVGVETLRARASAESLGRLYWDWGIPTAASILQVRHTSMEVIATGGIKSGLDVAKAVALGATACGLARPFLMVYNESKREGVAALAAQITHEFRIAMLLTGSANVSELRATSYHLDPVLARWDSLP